MATANTLCTRCLTYYPEGASHVCAPEALQAVNQFKQEQPELVQPTTNVVPVTLVSATEPTIKGSTSDGSSAVYYEFPEDSRELIDLMEHKNMGYSQGNIFKASYRLGDKMGTTILYDLNKIIYFATRMKNAAIKAGATG